MTETAQSPGSGTPDVPIPHEDNGDPASEKELGDLAAHWNGSNATSPTGSQSESHLDTPPKTGNPGSSGEPPGTDEGSEYHGPGGEPEENFVKIPRSSSRGRPEKELPPPGSPSPKPRAARESRRGTPPTEAASETQGPGEPPPTEEPQPAIEPPPGETPAEPQRWTQEAALRDIEAARQRVRADAANDIARIDQEAQAHQPPSTAAETPAPGEKPPEAPTTTPSPEVAEPPRPENKLEEQVEERFSRVKTGTVLSDADQSWRIGKIEEKEIGGHPVTLYWTKRADGTPFYFSEGDVKQIIRDYLSEERRVAEAEAAVRIRQEKANQQAAGKAVRESARVAREQQIAAERAEREKQSAAEREEKEAARAAKAHEEEEHRKAFEKAKTERSESFDRRLQKRLETLQKAKAGTELQRGKQTLKFLNYDEFISNPYKFEDKTGQTIYLAQAEVKKLLAEKVRAEDKTALEQLKQKPEKEKPTAAEKEEAKGAEKPTPKWKERLAIAGVVAEKAGGAVKKGAEVTPVTRILYDIINRSLNKFDYRDKEKYWYIAGIAAGAGTNVGLVFVPFLQFGPGRVVRSAVFSGGLVAASYTSNRFRNSAVEKILKDFGVENSTDRKSFARQLDEAFRLLRSNREEDYHYNMKEISKRIFLKYGTAEHKADMESQVSVEARNALIGKIEVLNSKYQKLNSRIRSFSAGLTVGTLGSSLGFGLWPKVQSLFDRIHGGGHMTPVPGIEHGAPTHAPPVEGHTATPTPTPGLEHTPTPIPGHVPPGTSPEALHVFQSLPPDQQARLTDIASDPAKLDAFNHWIAAHEAILPGAQPISEILANPDLAHSVVIHSGNTVGQIFVNNGQPINWAPGNADLFGTHVLANYDMLHTMHDNVVAAGLATSDFPTQEAVVGLIKAADGGDAASFQQLVDAAHWIPVGDNWNELTNTGIEAIKKRYGLP